jgi:hypothetical protein
MNAPEVTIGIEGKRQGTAPRRAVATGAFTVSAERGCVPNLRNRGAGIVPDQGELTNE